MFDYGDADFSDGISCISGYEASEFTCFRCGVWCSKYHVQVSVAEALEIAAGLDIGWDDWLNKYTDPSLSASETFILRRHQGLCVFLEPMEDGKTFACRIHKFKPSLCLEWVASLYQRDCQEGLNKFWGLKVSPSGEIQGPREKLKEFYAFLSKINGGIVFNEPDPLNQKLTLSELPSQNQRL